MVSKQDTSKRIKTVPNLFDIIPVGFFNYLASNSNHRIYTLHIVGSVRFV